MIQYADDAIIIMQSCEAQLNSLRNILSKIEQSSGWKVNYHKSCIVPINVDQQKVEGLASALGYIVGSFPFTYLGLPMGIAKP